MAIDLDGAVALVTRGANGIGAAAADPQGLRRGLRGHTGVLDVQAADRADRWERHIGTKSGRAPGWCGVDGEWLTVDLGHDRRWHPDQDVRCARRLVRKWA
jgi:NAD(P)-dependent dehydrogenase (short-subunit alcohol dehydrogenase family)